MQADFGLVKGSLHVDFDLVKGSLQADFDLWKGPLQVEILVRASKVLYCGKQGKKATMRGKADFSLS